MNNSFFRSLFFIVLLGVFSITQGQVKNKIDWPKFMAQHDLVWEDIPLQWAEGAFVGNGQLGMMLYAKKDENRFNFHVGRQDVTDHRQAPNKKTSMGLKGTNLMDFSRLDIGKMTLHPAGKIQSANIRQDLWNAEIRGTIITDLGEITFRAFTPYDKMVQVIEASSNEKKMEKILHLPGNGCQERHLVQELIQNTINIKIGINSILMSQKLKMMEKKLYVYKN